MGRHTYWLIYRRGRLVYLTSLLKRLNRAAENINQHKALGSGEDTITDATYNLIGY